MRGYLAACGLSLVVAAVLTCAVRFLALRFGLLDRASSSRKIHAVPVPRLGGLGILGGMAVTLFAFGFLRGAGAADGDPGLQIGVVGCGLATAALGLYDDLRGADARVKFCVQFLVAGAVYFSGLRITGLPNPFGPPLALGVLSLPLTLVWVVGVVNAVNLIDGLDGLAGGVTLVAVGTELVLAGRAGDPAMCLLLAVLGGAVLGFLIFNVNPASIFMGDSGSMFIGFLLAVIPLRLSSQGGGTASLLIPILGLGLPIADTLLSVIRRALAGRPLFSADKEHIHHRVLRQVGGSQRRAVARLFAACSAFGAAGAVLAFLRGAPAIALLAGVTVAALYLLHRLGCFGSSAELRVLRERNRRLRALGREVRQALAGCRSPDEVGTALGRVAAPLACRLEISLEDEGGRARRFAFRHPGAPPEVRGLDWACAVVLAGRPVGEVRATWFDGRSEVDRDEERFLEALLVHIAWALSRRRALVPGRRGTGSFEGT